MTLEDALTELSKSLVIGTKEVAQLLDTSERTAARILKSGQMRAFKMNGRIWRTTGEMVREYIDRHLCGIDSTIRNRN